MSSTSGQRAGKARRIAWLILLGCAVIDSPARAQSLEDRLQPLIAAHQGQVAVCVRHLPTGQSYRARADVPMPTASLIKLAVMVEAYRMADAGTLDLSRTVVLRDEDKVPGSGILTPHFSAGAQFSLRDAIRLMMAYSDNTATNLVLDAMGLASTARGMEALGLPNTKIHAKVFRRDTSIFPERSERFGLGSTTADEMVALLQLVHERRLASERACQAMEQHLLACEDKRKFPRFLPPEARIMHKTGSLDRVRTDAGLLVTPQGTVALCVLTTENADSRWTDDNAGDLLCANVARQVYAHFAARPARPAQPPARPEGQPRPPAGAAAAGDEQQDDGVLSSGQGQIRPILLAEGSAARAPRDPLRGLPFTSCKAWLIADARTGERVAAQNAEARLDAASLTKIMTALLVLEAIADNRANLDEQVTFSRRADETPGSSCGVCAGERLALRDLLYGLLLPSGNDAAVALAEGVGGRLRPASDKKSAASDPVARFVSQMNRKAGQLGLANTRFINPHGLPGTNQGSCASDLAALTRAALQHDLFRQIVASREYQARLRGADGTVREVTWKNTNRLLAIEGYLGVKTGFTKNAGSCLVSLAQRRDDELIVVVLGAASSAAAVADSRNLYRWAWQERGHQE